MNAYLPLGCVAIDNYEIQALVVMATGANIPKTQSYVNKKPYCL
ncbi:hypothetical protein [Psychrobacter aquaticus]|uniref:Uncharacterized protein n=1 Tax=Psychrobacter aquaticus CMS 56 TaxID=1354303 RepID=U4T9X4_9GAMM|nr:hypothetical protein [Psychrobacter aquaticus]ERL55283.1 hypothetical protein M917_1807 [Psychrobacter aquaticus CMS 56]